MNAASWRARLEIGPAAGLGLLSALFWALWASFDGGFFPDEWGPLGVVLVAVVAAVAAVIPVPTHHLDRRRFVALAALIAFTGWNYISIFWAAFPGDAWIGSDKTLLYATTFAGLALWPWKLAHARVIVGLYVAAIAVLGIVTLVGAATSTVETFGEEGRLVGPTGYVNASVALWMLAIWPAVHLGSLETVAPVLRAAALGAAALFLDLAVLGQSRGWLAAAPAAAVLYVLLARRRQRALLSLAIPSACTLAILDPLLEVFDRFRLGDSMESAADRAVVFAVLSALAAAALGFLWALLDKRFRVGERARRRIAVLLAVVGLAGLLGGGVVIARAVDDPAGWLEQRWDGFVEGSPPAGESSTRLGGSLATHRYEEWKVAWAEFRSHPVIGIGADNYQANYLLRRSEPEHAPRYPHSIELRLLSQLGVVGATLFAVWAAAAAALALARRRALSPAGGDTVAALLTVGGYWLLHGSLDWFFEIPALAAPAFGALAIAGAIVVLGPAGRAAAATTHSGSATRSRTRRARSALALAAIVGGAAVALPWLSYSLKEAGAAVWRSDPATAYSRLELAADLNPLSAETLVVAGSIALRRRDDDRAQAALARALDREPQNWYAHFQLGLLAGSRGDYEAAMLHVERARALNPLEPGVLEAARLVAEGSPIDPDQLNAAFVEDP